VTRCTYPILEYDAQREAHIEPSKLIKPQDVPEHCVLCFFQEVISGLVQERAAQQVARSKSEMGEHPLYEIVLGGQRLAVLHPGVGAPHAAALLEEAIAFGCSKFVACGGAGVLDPTLVVGHVIVPTSAVRDEGTSYHYLPPTREVQAHSAAVAAIEETLQAHQCEYLLAKTWTTDAIYRETPGKIRQRRAEGCVTVEMEAAAFFAVAQFRAVPFGQILYGGDDVGSETWDARDWDKQNSVREKLFWLAAEACLRLQSTAFPLPG
jgi:uridine phosphorylase